jgi:uncharacterized BrkB/YihY/UPF0761 family membrane protein
LQKADESCLLQMINFIVSLWLTTIWVYYSAQVFFVGAEVTRVFANEYGARIVPHHRSLGGWWRRPSV